MLYMITEDLIAYIQAQHRKNVSDNIIKSRLKDAGWYDEDVSEAFRKIMPPPAPSIISTIPQPISKPPILENPSITVAPINISEKNVSQEKTDPYREKFIQDEPKIISDKVWAPIKFTPKEPTVYAIPQVEKKLELQITPTQNSGIIKPIFSQSFSEANQKIPSLKQNSPVSAEIKPVQQPNTETRLEVRSEELIPGLISKQSPVEESKPINKNYPLSGLKFNSDAPKVVSPMASDLPNNALLHSYQRALISATEINEGLFKKKRNKFLKWLLVILFISIIGGSVFAIEEGYVKLPPLHFSFIKKDPKSILIAAPIMLNELKGYKIETEASLTLPAFADITSGLLSGEAVLSKDKDSFSIVAKGIVNNDSQLNPIFDYKATLSSSLFEDKIVTNIKHNDLISIITIPDLTEVLGPNAPKPTNVSVPKGQFDSFFEMLPESIRSKVGKIDIDKFLSVGALSYINDETNSIFKEFVSSATVIEKAQENIEGTLSYHYELSADREATKKLLREFIGIFTTDLSQEDKANIDESLGAVTLDSLEVWIGKEDGKIHQYAFTLKSPLSRIIGLDDKGIAGNVVSFDWKTSYYDFDVHNNVSFPEKAMSLEDFMKIVADMKIKDKIYSFKLLADNFHNAVGSFGKRSNTAGSCLNPIQNSIFSPIGHPKGASVAVGDIASLMNDILGTTMGVSSCYSSPNAWAISVPLVSDPALSFCLDSTGITKTINTPIQSTACL